MKNVTRITVLLLATCVLMGVWAYGSGDAGAQGAEPTTIPTRAMPPTRTPPVPGTPPAVASLYRYEVGIGAWHTEQRTAPVWHDMDSYHEGAWSLRLEGNHETGYAGFRLREGVDTTRDLSGGTNVLRVWVRADGYGSTARFSLYRPDYTGVEQSNPATALTAGKWVEVTGQFTAAQLAATRDIVLTIEGYHGHEGKLGFNVDDLRRG